MSEESKVAVSDKDIAAVEQQVKAREAADMKAVEEKVRTEMAAEQRAKELEAKLAEQAAVAEAAKADAAKARAEAEAIIKKQAEDRLRAEQAAARSKAPVSGANPFGAGPSRAEEVLGPIRTDPALQTVIENNSLRAFMERGKR